MLIIPAVLSWKHQKSAFIEITWTLIYTLSCHSYEIFSQHLLLFVSQRSSHLLFLFLAFTECYIMLSGILWEIYQFIVMQFWLPKKLSGCVLYACITEASSIDPKPVTLLENKKGWHTLKQATSSKYKYVEKLLLIIISAINFITVRTYIVMVLYHLSIRASNPCLSIGMSGMIYNLAN